MAMDGLVALLLVGFLLCFAAALPYVFVERRWRWRWNEVASGRVPAAAPGGIYRDAGDVPRYYVEAPRRVRWAAFTCLLFGQMFVPGLLVGAFGLIAGGLGVVSIPGLITAAKLYRAGLSLLRREPRLAYFRARDAAAWALWLNAIILAGSLVLLALPIRPTSHAGLDFVAFVDGYGVASILQALLLRLTARAYEDALFADSTHPFGRPA